VASIERQCFPDDPWTEREIRNFRRCWNTYFVCNGRYAHDGTVAVESVGRKWVKLKRGYRFDRTDPVGWRRLDRDGGTNSPGYLYDSVEQYAEIVEKLRILSLVKEQRWSGHAQQMKVLDMKLEDIKTAARILGCEV